MAGTKYQNFRIKIIDDLLSRKGWVKTETIKKAIEAQLLETVSTRTVQQDITDMRENTLLGYYAPIDYDRKRKAYSYTEDGYTIKNFSLRPEEIDALKFYAECLQVFSGYKLFSAFSSGIGKILNGVQVRKQLKPTTDAKLIVQTDSDVSSGGDEYISDLVYAIDNKFLCEINYRPYGARSYPRRVLPLLLKEYRNRWYLIAYKPENKEIRTYALDRIKSCTVSENQLSQLPGFDPQAYFQHSFGISRPDAKPETIVLQFTANNAPYLQSLQIHKTQKVLKKDDKFIVISITVMLSYEVYEFILGKSPDIKVLSPAHLANDIARKLEKAARQYRKK